MVTVIIYLDNTHSAKEFVNILLSKGLIANASIDSNNVSYRMENSEIIENLNSVITVQAKSLLFSKVDKFIKEKYGSHVPIFSLPITQASESFDTMIRGNTLKI